MTRRTGMAALLAAHVFFMAPPAAAMQILDAADHAELAAEISATQVNRIALHGDRIARVVRSPDGMRSSTTAPRATSICAPRPWIGVRGRPGSIPSPCSSARRRASPTG